MNKALIFLLIFLISPICRAVDEQQANIWTTAVLNGRFKTNPSYFYQVETHLRFNDNPLQLRQNVDRIRFGKHFNKTWDLVLGFDYVPTKLLPHSQWMYNQNLWQQLAYKKRVGNPWLMTIWTRLDERKEQGASGIGYLNRTGIRFSGCKEDSIACPIMFIENFTYINRPAWEELKTLGQQRIYFAIKAVLSSKNSVNVGYLGQFLWAQEASARFDVLSIVYVHHMD